MSLPIQLSIFGYLQSLRKVTNPNESINAGGSMGEFLYLTNLNFHETRGFPLVKLTPCDIIWIPQGSKNQIW